MTISPNGKRLYVAGSADAAVAVFNRDNNTGMLNFAEMLQDGQGGVEGLNGATSVTVSPEGKHLYVAGLSDSAVAYFGNYLFLDKEVSSTNIQPGQTLTYRLTISNSGSLSATGGTLSDPLPSGLTFVGPVTIEGGSGLSGTPPLIATNLTIPARQTITVSFPVQVDIGTEGQILTNTASITSSEITSPVTDSISVIVSPSSLSLNKTVNDPTPIPGQALNYTFNILNDGTLPVTQAVLSDTLPSGLTFIGPVTIEGTIGTAGAPPHIASGLTIDVGQSITVRMPVMVDDGTEGQTLTNKATITSSEVVSPVQDQVVITIGSSPDNNATLYLPTIKKPQ